MDYSHQGLLDMASVYDGRSCGEDGSLGDSITGQADDGMKFTGSRMDQNGTFQDVNMCCIVQKCVFGTTPSACAGMDLMCPSEWGRINPRTCQNEEPKLDSDGQEIDNDAHRQGYYRSQKECCYAKVLLDGCTARSPDHKTQKWETVCCPYDWGDGGDSDNLLTAGTPRESEGDFLIA